MDCDLIHFSDYFTLISAFIAAYQQMSDVRLSIILPKSPKKSSFKLMLARSEILRHIGSTINQLTSVI